MDAIDRLFDNLREDVKEDVKTTSLLLYSITLQGRLVYRFGKKLL
jgi:hypothetical protein